MSAKILLLDIETAPSLGYVWGKYDQNVVEFERDWYILSFAGKYLGDKSIDVHALPDYPRFKSDKSDDKPLLNDLYNYLDAADIVVAHNGASFDVKKINARFLVHGIKPPSTYKIVDTLKEFKRNFRFDSNKLDDLCKTLGIGSKLKHIGFALWKGCMEGDLAAWKVMKQYNAHDVELLEEIYLRVRPWTKHPDVTLYGGAVRRTTVDAHCPACGGDHIQRRGTTVARTRRYQRLNCQDCGHWFQGELEKLEKLEK